MLPSTQRALVAAPISLLLTLALGPQAPPPYKNRNLPVADRVRDLLSRMTLEEKFWQTFMIPGDLDNPANDYSHGIFGLQISVGSPQRGRAAGADAAAIARAHAERINAIQKYFVDETRLGIPIIPFEEAVHGLPLKNVEVLDGNGVSAL